MRGLVALFCLCRFVQCANAELPTLYREENSSRDVSNLTTFDPGDELILTLKMWNENDFSWVFRYDKYVVPVTGADDGKTFVWDSSIDAGSYGYLNWFNHPPAPGAVWVFRPFFVSVTNLTDVRSFCSETPDTTGCEFEIVERMAAIGPTVSAIDVSESHWCSDGTTEDVCAGNRSTQFRVKLDMFPAPHGRTAVAIDLAVYRVPEPAAISINLTAAACWNGRRLRRVRRNSLRNS